VQVRQHFRLVQALDAQMQLLNEMLLLHDHVLAANERNSQTHDQVGIDKDICHLHIDIENSGLATYLDEVDFFRFLIVIDDLLLREVFKSVL